MLPRLRNDAYVSLIILSLTLFIIFDGSRVGVDLMLVKIVAAILSPLIFIPIGMLHRNPDYPSLSFLSPLYYNLNPLTESKDEIKQYINEGENLAREARETDTPQHSEKAIDLFSKSLMNYRAALDKIDDPDRRSEIETTVSTLREERNDIRAHLRTQTALREAIQTGEESFQEAIRAFLTDEQTLARIRFRQAREAFGEAITVAADSEDDLFARSIEIQVQPDQKLPSTTLSELSILSDAAVTKLADTGIENIDDLDSSAEPPWTPPAADKLADTPIEQDIEPLLTLLSWWHDGDSHTVDTQTEVSRRQQQATYGFNQTSD